MKGLASGAQVPHLQHQSQPPPPAIPPKSFAAPTGSGSPPQQTVPQLQPLSQDLGLESKTLEELEEMMTDPRAFEEHLFTLRPIVEAQQLREEASRVNAEAAARTLSLRPDLDTARESLRASQSDFKAALQSYELTCKEYEDAVLVHAPDYLLSRLRAAQSESDELCDSLVSSLLSGEVAVEDFMKRYREARKMYHSRSIRVERAERDPSVLV
ncbi:hypothetical protein BC830DRAFT_128269 [Chytriomyces sp. MP71]|nr:hypothetical protein BC830DRAFT_128269 [Chytriomyces sp. MP71]